MQGLVESFTVFAFAGFASFWGCLIANRFIPAGLLGTTRTSRSNHTGSPRQLGGIALVASVSLTVMLAISVLSSSMLALSWSHNQYLPVTFLLSTLVLAFLLGLADDLKGLGVRTRLLIQTLIAISIVYSSDWPAHGSVVVFTFLVLLAVIACIYWINAVNFMDGLDWLLVSGMTLPLVFHALLLMQFTSPHNGVVGLLALSSAGGLLGFAFWNRPPATLFMGDSGSIFLGAMSCMTILAVSKTLGLMVAITPFLFFIMDSASTILFRLLNGENILRAHSVHAYQIAYRKGKTAGDIAFETMVLNVWLVVLSALMLATSAFQASVLFALGCASTALFVLRLRI